MFNDQATDEAKLGPTNRQPACGHRGGYSREQTQIFIACLFLLGVLGWVDYRTGYELGFFIAYSAPVGLVAWHLGRWPGIFTAFLASIAWWMADSLDGEKYSHAFYWIWNNVVHFLSFVINAVAIAEIKTDLDELHQVRAELDVARHTLRHIAPLMPTCPACNKIHALPPNLGHTTWPSDISIVPEISGALCADCAAKISEPPRS